MKRSDQYLNYKKLKVLIKENRMYIRVEFRKSLGMNFFSPFQPEREFKVYKVEYINTVCSLDYPFQFRIFKICLFDL